MPRVTRAALRSRSNNEESDNTSTAPPPASSTPTRRPPLGETSGNQENRSLMIINPEKVTKALNKGIVKGKKSKALNKTKENVAPIGHQNNGDIVLKDDYESETSSAVNEACQALTNSENRVLLPEISQQVIDLDQQSHSLPSPPSPAAELAAEQLSVTIRTSEAFSPHHSTLPMDQTSDVKGEHHYDVPSKASSPWLDMARNSSLTDGPYADSSIAGNDDSPEGKTSEGISSKSATRIEDSVEALDNLEEEIEVVDGLIPKLVDIFQPSPSTLKGRKEVSNSKVVKPKQFAGEKSQKAPSTKSSNAVATVNMETPLKDKKDATETASKQPAAIRVASDSTRSSSIQGDSAKKPLNATKKRISSVHKPPFVPAKSSKPPTRSNFELPGETVARKLKEAREVRLKREEEEKPQRKSFKARPIRLSQAPVVRLTAASKARISLSKGEAKETSLKPGTMTHPNKFPDGNRAKRLSTLAVAECKEHMSTKPSARAFGRLSTGATATSGKVLTPRLARPSVSAADAAQSKLKGKEVFNRGRVEQQERNQVRRNQEVAAKKARAEAAERGRIASREWAEKQRARRLAAQNSSREMGKAV
ncbi:MAG: hypothetical protein Q9214_003069 [Letrouitia sp. 1 TL-2023]